MSALRTSSTNYQHLKWKSTEKSVRDCNRAKIGTDRETTDDVANGVYLLAGVREPTILKTLRLHLVYLHDQLSSVYFEAHTKTGIKLVASELASDVESLRKLYFSFHNLCYQLKLKSISLPSDISGKINRESQSKVFLHEELKMARAENLSPSKILGDNKLSLLLIQI